MSIFATLPSVAAASNSRSPVTSFTLSAPAFDPLPALESKRLEDGSFSLSPETGKALVLFLAGTESYRQRCQDRINEQWEIDQKERQIDRMEQIQADSEGIPLWLAVVGIGGAGAAGVVVGVLVGMLSQRTVVVSP